MTDTSKTTGKGAAKAAQAIPAHAQGEEGGVMRNETKPSSKKQKSDPDTEPDWNGKCEVCGASPIIPCTGMCGPCTFGEAETTGGNW